jgi:hypothetical protein
MSKKAPKVESLKVAFALLFMVGLMLCFWMDNSLGAFIVLLVGGVMGGLARDVKYAEQRKPSEVTIPDALKNSDAAEGFYDAVENHLVQFNPHRGHLPKLDVDGESLDDEYRVLRRNLTNGNNQKR